MPSVDDLFNQLIAANNRLQDIKGELIDVKAGINQINTTLTAAAAQLINLLQYADQALAHDSKQNDTIICILEHISRNTCVLVNQATMQTALQTEMEEDIDALESMFASVNPAATLERKRLHHLKEEIERCCPPPKPELPCHYRPCAVPPALGDPPKLPGRPTTQPPR
jgi:hypothetical protein